MAIQTKLRKWGNSLGIVIPSEALKENKLSEGEEVIVELRKKNTIKELFGSLKNWKIDAQKFKDERREEDKRNDAKLLS